MIPINLHLIAVTRRTWTQWPNDRPLALLVKDAKAMERRAAKGVNVTVERGLFLQLARRISILALGKAADCPQLPPVRLADADLDACLRLHENLFEKRQALKIPQLAPLFKQGDPVLKLRFHGSSFFSPAEAELQHQFFAAAKAEELSRALASDNGDAARRMAEVWRVKETFYKNAGRLDCGVVEVINLD